MRLAILAAALLPVCACTRQTDVPAPASYIATKHPKAIWVASATAAVRVDNPHVDGDTILGVQDGRPFTVPSSDMTVVSVRRIDWVATAFVAAGTGLVVYAVASANHTSVSPHCPVLLAPTPEGCEPVPGLP
ncbi:MAG TPA: hypothetical protein VN848_06260 [Gemmatimonadales bacterium]|nr:hypothetical protein [Gemmatimonadales bacterium]